MNSLNALLVSGAGTGIIVAVVALIIFMIILLVATRIKRCPSDKIMVVYGKVSRAKDGTHRSSKCVHGGTEFIVPLFQSYAFLDLTPISISVDLKSALSRQNIRIDVPSIFTVGISTEQGVMQNAAERLLGLKLAQIQELAKDIIFGQLRLVIATMDIEEINTDRDKFLEAVSRNVEGELKKIGLRLINVNVTDISDESGYIVALGKEAAAKAINDAKISVAEEDRKGAIGEANATYAKMEAQARGVKAVLSAQAEGLAEIVRAAGGDTNEAARLMIADKIEQIVATQVEAIKNVKIDKVTVWDGNGNAANGKTATANFLSGLTKSLPPMSDLFDMAGLSMPEIIKTKKTGEETKTQPEEKTDERKIDVSDEKDAVKF